MDRTRVHEGVRQMRFEGVLDRRLGKASPHRAGVAEIARMLELYRGSYADFTVKHFHEQLVKRHDYKLGYTVTKVHLQLAGLVRPAPKRSAHRKKRPRRPMVGMMLHQDASSHAWLPGGDRRHYSAFLVDEEGTASSLRGLREVVERHGLFCAFYTDRASHYFHTPEAAKAVSKTQLTQVGRALKQLGIEHIAAYSPQARGRSERAFRTLQDRLPKELALAGIPTVDAANRWLAETYIPAYNAAFAVVAEQEGSAFLPDRTAAWREILAIQEDRTVGNDNTVKWQGLCLQLPPRRLRPHFVKAVVRLHQYPDGTLAVFLGPHRLADYDADGKIIQATE